ncbi:ATP-binding cassette domain-containing protein [Streptococcus cameli]
MLHIQDLTISHQKDLKTLVKELDLMVHPGDKLAIIGEEGTGKSTLIKAIVEPETITDYVQIEGQFTNHFSTIGYLGQNLPTIMAEQTVTEFLYQDMDYERFDFQVFYRYTDMFQLDIEAFEEKQQRLATLSGGEKIKLQLLKVLAYNPDCLILDEPTSDLDLETVTWLEHFIEESDKAILFISHDETLLTTAATAILHLELVKKRQEPRWTYFHGNYADYLIERKERFSKQLQVANKERENHKKRMTENNRIQQRVEHQLRHTKNGAAGRLLAKKMHSLQSQERRFLKEAEGFTEIPEDMDSLRLFFSGIEPLPAKKLILNWQDKQLPTGQEIDLAICGQDKLVITGQNGIGKTLLLQKIHQELSERTDISVSYMPQHYEQALPNTATALEFLSDCAGEETVRTFLASLQFTRQEIHHSVADLSGGQKAKLFLAKMVLSKHNVLILDEPTRHFSPTSQPLVRQLLADFPGCIISVSHDRAFIKELGQKQYHLTKRQLDTQSL